QHLPILKICSCPCQAGPKATAVAEDGLVEGIYAPDREYIQAVQWHPEFMSPGDADAGKIFRSFIEGSKGHA
uniref:gamma-glutamyl-gamma-aminobutyrate hydrolase family protein n=1 Tax=Enterocloster clostridioformis TaxID=1531 RepID=UPI003078B0FB